MATKGIVKGIVSNLVTVEVDGPVSQNEICYISVGGVKLMAEVIKVIGKNAFVQLFESTRGMRVGDEAEFEGHMLEVTLGPDVYKRQILCRHVSDRPAVQDDLGAFIIRRFQQHRVHIRMPVSYTHLC